MSNCEKRKFITCDVNYVENDKLQKKIKNNGWGYEHQSTISWNEVKVILDGTVVDKYMNKLKSVDKFKHVNQRVNNVFSNGNNVMVKLELSEDISLNNLALEENLPFENVTVKEENHISIDTENNYSDDIICNVSAESELDIIKNDEIHADFSEKETETVLKDETIDCKELTIEPEFQHTPNYELTEETIETEYDPLAVEPEFKYFPNYDFSEEIRETTVQDEVQENTRTQRKKKTIQKDVLRKFRKPSSYNKKVKRKNKCKTSLNNIPQQSSSKRKSKKKLYKLYQCDHCYYAVSGLNILSRHLKSRHPLLFDNKLTSSQSCEENPIVQSETNPPSQPSSECQVDLVSNSSREEITENDKLKEDSTAFAKLYCTRCQKKYDASIPIKTQDCPTCKIRLLYQCQSCNLTSTSWRAIDRHLQDDLNYCGSSRSEIKLTNNVGSTATTSNEKSQEMSACKDCAFKTRSEFLLLKHILLRHKTKKIKKYNFANNTPYKCSKCNWKFNRINCDDTWQVNKHAELCGINKCYPCRFCHTICANLELLKMHLRTHFFPFDMHEDNIIEEIKSFKKMIDEINDARVSKHFRPETTAERRASGFYVDGIQSILKPLCLKCKTSAEQFFVNCVDCHARLESFQCLRCDIKFSKYSDAWAHVTRYCKNRMFTLTFDAVTNHINSKLQEQKGSKTWYDCDYCGLKTYEKNALISHIRKEHSDEFDSKTCSKCYKIFNSEDSLNLHKCSMSCTYKCTLCNKTSMHLKTISEHVIKDHAHHFNVKLADQPYDVIRKLKSLQKRSEDNLNSVKFSCEKCNEVVIMTNKREKNCSKCQTVLKMECKHCGLVSDKWKTVLMHFLTSRCQLEKSTQMHSSKLDHSYSCT